MKIFCCLFEVYKTFFVCFVCFCFADIVAIAFMLLIFFIKKKKNE